MRAGVRSIDTSTLGPIRIEPRQSDRAREAFAAKLEQRGPSYHNAADSVRAGYSNIWIDAGVAALETLFRRLPEDDD